MPFILFHLTIIIMLATSLHLILSVIKFVKISKEKEPTHLISNSEENQKPIEIDWTNKRQILIQHLEDIKINVKNLHLTLEKLNKAIEKRSKDNQKLLQQYFRPYQWVKSNKK